MKQKRVTLLALVLILTMCGGNSATTEIVESVEEVETKQSQQEDTQVNREEVIRRWCSSCERRSI